MTTAHLFTHTHLDDGREHVRCTRCGDCAALPQGDRRGVGDWKRRHRCPPRPAPEGGRDAA